MRNLFINVLVVVILAVLGVLVWNLIDPPPPALDEEDSEEPLSAAPDMFQVPPVASTSPTDDGRFQRATADLERDDSELDLVEIHIEFVEYVVVEGDSLWQLEKRFGVRFELIYEFNRLAIERNFARRCGEPSGYSSVSLGHCSTPEATIEQGMVLLIPTDIWIAPIRSYKM